ncbi:hypothetical protein SDC9_37016 [bioreactor metagenome]|uniref:HTH cro/C1-type domain-containing protein n=1 Tax=bioreactor metagenome TaxID=1076179 RepID=A0A644VI94_9ZZZZ|nr:hypothetical protein [Lentimicrobium sp.]MEA5110415.1 hypothetical protein [Lentimicrobium sp.]
MTVKERLLEFIKYKGIPVRKFESIVGLSNGYVGNMRVSIQPDKISSIALKFPELDTGWLLTGEGSMLKEDKKDLPVESQAAIDNISKALEIIQSQQAAITKLSDAALIQARNIEKLLEGNHLPGTNHDRRAG